jgi:hypothetical protein
MTEGTRHNGLPRPEAPGADFSSDQALESAAFAGAAAVQRLIADRNGLRNRLSVQERELMGFRGAHEDLRRRVVTLQQNYVELAKKVVSQLEHFDISIRELLQERHDLNVHKGEAAGIPEGPPQFDRSGLPVGSLPTGADATVTRGNNGSVQKGRASREP